MKNPKNSVLSIGSPFKGGQQNGFSLIEVTIAVAITAVALVSLMGMLPQGVKTMSVATDKAIEARIQQQIVGELMLTEWEQRGVFDGQLRGYDDQGIHIQTDTRMISNKSAESVIYTARIQVPNKDVMLPGGDVDQNLQLVLLNITNLSVDNFDFDDPKNKRHIHTYQTILAKMGQIYN